MADSSMPKSAKLLRVAEAQSLLRQHAHPLPAVTLPLGPDLLGLVLAEDVASDLDMPPYDKSMMDGYAVRCADLPDGQATLTIIEEIPAGYTPRQVVSPGQASRIMTGAPLPQGADAVVVIERSRLLDEGRVQIDGKPPRPGQNILPRASEMRAGETVMAAGSVLRPQELAVLATVGRSRVRVVPAPTVAILSTGDEVVEADATPGPGQIRNSNGPMLVAQALRAGGKPRYLGIARDRVEVLTPLVREGLQATVLILSGGVSAGKLDLVPGVLADAGVVAHFHKVEMKPGKPVFFGTREREKGTPPTLVFGLPGNPVSALVCFELFVRPTLRRLAGHAVSESSTMAAVLADDFAYTTDRPTYHPAWLEAAEGGWRVRVVPWMGSADLRALLRANALVLLPAGDHRHRAGQVMEVVSIG